MNRKFFSVILSILILFTFLSCEVNLTPNLDSNSSNQKNGSLSGKAVFSNSSDNSSIYITLDKSDGERTAAVLKASGLYDRNCYSIGKPDSDSRAVAGYQYCDHDGNFSFKNLEIGVYTVYAQSDFSKERAVKTNVIVKETGTTVLDTIELVATGSLSGTITLDNSTDKNDGFIVFISGTSYYGITDKSGNFKIENIPAQKNYPLIISYKNFKYNWPNKIEVVANKATTLGTVNFTTEQIEDAGNSGSGSGSGSGNNTPGNKDCTIMYVLNGGTLGANSPSVAKYGEPAVTLVAPSKTDSTFLGWYNNENFSGTAITQVSASENDSIMLFAKWACDCNIIYILNGGALGTDSPAVAKYGEPAVTLVAPSKTNAQFLGWYTNQNFSGDAVTQVSANGNDSIMLFAKWVSASDCKITYFTNGGTLGANSPSVAKYGEPAVTLVVPSKTDSTFLGWYNNENFSGTAITQVSASENDSIMLFAKWASNCKITYFTNGGTLGANSPSIAKYGEPAVTLVTPSKTNYIFDGWYTSDDYSGTAVTQVEADGKISTFLFAKWICQINYELDGGSFPSEYPTKAVFGQPAVTLPVPAKANYTFGGWYSNEDLSDSQITQVSANGEYSSITLYALWLEKVQFEDFSSLDFWDMNDLFSNYEDPFDLVVPDNIQDNDYFISVEDECSSFWMCNNLSSIQTDESNPVYDSRNDCNALIETASNKLILGCKNTVIPDTVTTIGSFAFDNLDGYEGSVVIEVPDSVTELEPYAFFCARCDDLTITLGNGITKIPEGAFQYSGITSIVIPEGVTEIGDDAFNGCESLVSIQLPQSLKKIGNNAFNSCSNLKSIQIPSNLEEIGTYAFSDCENLQEVKGLETSKITKLPGQLFFRCYSLESVILPETVTEIGTAAFYECNKLSTINIPKNVNTIIQNDNNLFYGCICLRKITVDSANTTYDSRDNCNAIIETATNTLVTGCSRTTIPETVEVIGNYALYGVPYTTILIPHSVTKIETAALFITSGTYKSELKIIYYVGTFDEWVNNVIGSNYYTNNSSIKKVYLKENN